METSQSRISGNDPDVDANCEQSRCPVARGLHRVLVLDFDQTLACEEVSLLGSKEHAVVVFGGEKRIDALSSMLAEVISAGVTPAICSFNDKKIIGKSLAAVGLRKFFDGRFILGYGECLTDNNPTRIKGRAIEQAIMRPLDVAAENVLFVDDNPRNISEFQSFLPSAKTMLIPHASAPAASGGMQPEHMVAVVAWSRSL
eukprot:6172575-Pleurochrysis_carterae.AAC.2